MLCAVLLGLLQTTWVVDAAAGPGSNFTDLPAAIAAAAPGDTILVLPGTYSAFALAGKGVAIRGAGRGITIVNGPSNTVGATPAGFTDLLSGMTLHGGLNAQVGAVLTLTDCEIIGTSGVNGGYLGLYAHACQVFALRCSFRGGDAIGPPSPFTATMSGGHGAYVSSTRFAASECTFVGGDVPNPGGGPSYAGGGAWLDSSTTARLNACSLTGGSTSGWGIAGDGAYVRTDTRVDVDGGPANVIARGSGLIPGGPLGGNAIRVEAGAPFSHVIVRGTVTLSGPVYGPVTLGAPSLPRLSVDAATLASGETDSTQPVTVRFDGQTPSMAFVFLLGFRPSYTPVQAPFFGDLLMDLSASALMSGPLDLAGQFQFAFVPLSIFGGPVPFPFYMQFAVLEANGDVRLSHLDARFYSL